MAKRTCTDPECRSSATNRGMCQMHYQRWRRTIAPGVELPPSRQFQQPVLIDRTGQRYGRLVIVRQGQTRLVDGHWRTHWLCRCDCGNETEVTSLSLKQQTPSCGCIQEERKSVSSRAARNGILRSYKKSASDRGRCWELTEEDFDRLTSEPCHYCGIQPCTVGKKRRSRFTYNGIDRMDNTLGYAIGNVVSCCKTCNMIKGSMPYDDFMAWIARMTEYHWFHPDVTPSRLLRDARKSA